jgi:hypothetical protein
MALPQAVVRKAAEADAHLRAAADARAGVKPAVVAVVEPAAPDQQKTLSDTQAELTKATEALKALEGKYNAEVPRAAADLREAKAKIKKLEDEKKDAEALLKRKLDDFEVTGISEEERRLLGADVVKTTAKIASEVVSAMMATSLKPLQDQVDQFRRMTEEQCFGLLDDRVPDWETINDQPKFGAWLRELDPATKRTRYDLLKRAEAGLQGHRLVEVFTAFKEGREIGAPPSPPNPLDARAEPAPGGASDPSGAKTADGKKIWVRSEIKAFYRRKQPGGDLYGKETEARVIESDVFAAQKEGRVRDG